MGPLPKMGNRKVAQMSNGGVVQVRVLEGIANTKGRDIELYQTCLFFFFNSTRKFPKL